MISIQDLVKNYGEFTAVDRLSLHVEPGEILGLVGPNGSGKTSTLRCLAGILPPTLGKLSIAGYDLVEQPIEARRRLAFVPDEPRLFDHLTVEDHLRFNGRLYGVADAVERAPELLDAVGLADKNRSFPDELSRGMKQKLMLAMALLHRPKALIFDEPLTGLDPRAMRSTKELIVETARQGTAILVSSHLLSLVQEICQRILILHQGRAVVVGTLSEIRSALPELAPGADLEEIFLRATEESPTEEKAGE